MATKAVLSEAEYLRTSFPGIDHEFHDGEIIERTASDPPHSRVQAKLAAFFVSREQTHRTFGYAALRLKPRASRIIIPDIAVFWPDLVGHTVPTGIPPLIAIEILSPDDRMSEVRTKLQEYTDWGVPHIWLIDPHTKRLYHCKDGLHEVHTYSIPELNLHLTPADLFD